MDLFSYYPHHHPHHHHHHHYRSWWWFTPGWIIGSIFFFFIVLIIIILATTLSSSSQLGSEEVGLVLNRARTRASTSKKSNSRNGMLLSLKPLPTSTAYTSTPYNSLQRKFLIIVLPNVKNNNNSTIKSIISSFESRIGDITTGLSNNAKDCAKSWYSGGDASTSVEYLGSNSIGRYSTLNVNGLPVLNPGIIPIFIGLVNNNNAYYGYHDYFSEEISSFPFSNYENTIVTVNYLISKFTPFIFVDMNAVVRYPSRNMTSGNTYGYGVNNLTTIISHEVCEVIVNPYVSNFSSDGAYYSSNGQILPKTKPNTVSGVPKSTDSYTYQYFWFVEACDAVQFDSTGAQSYYIQPGSNTAVSNFLYPSFFDRGISSNGYDRCDVIASPGYDAEGSATSYLSRIAIAPTNGNPTGSSVSSLVKSIRMEISRD